jgi:hypothetical protein
VRRLRNRRRRNIAQLYLRVHGTTLQSIKVVDFPLEKLYVPESITDAVIEAVFIVHHRL